MSEPENFVARWSRLKRQSELGAKEGADTAAPQAGAPVAPPTGETDGATPAEPAENAPPGFDLESLPSIDSITADTDIRSFLQSGVPASLTRAALRRAWTADPAIRDFIGIAENQWDFTDPTAMPGFGPLEATDDVQKLVAQAMGSLGETADRVAQDAVSGDQTAASGVQCTKSVAATAAPATGIQAAGMPKEKAASSESADAREEHPPVDAAARHDPKPAESGPAPNRRGHGSALPQ